MLNLAVTGLLFDFQAGRSGGMWNLGVTGLLCDLQAEKLGEY